MLHVLDSINGMPSAPCFVRPVCSYCPRALRDNWFWHFYYYPETQGHIFTFTQTKVRGEWFSYRIILALPNCTSAENVCRHGTPITWWWEQHKSDRFRMIFISTFLFLYVCAPCSVNESAFKSKKFLTLQHLEKRNLLFIWCRLPFFILSFLQFFVCN